MSNIEKYRNIFIKTFGVKEKELPALIYQGVDNWDSIGHMDLITNLEETFNISLDTDDIIEFNSFTKGIDILSKHGICF